jgi:sigma-B regulation protein RsbU (phosphoserine phosphatase)
VKRGALVASVLAALGSYVVATIAELAFIAAFQPTELELTWISDGVLALTVGAVTYFWLRLRATRATLSVVERDKLVLDTQLSLAAELQRSLLPALPADTARVQWGARLESAGKVGGDFFDLVSLNDGSVMFVVGDISGKGVPAAMLLAYTRAVFRTLAREDPEPGELVRRLSRALHRDTGGEPYVTCIVGRLETESGTLTYVNAGHPPGVVVRPALTLALDRGGPPAGLLLDASFMQHDVPLQPGDLVVLFTDGVTEALGTGRGSPADQILDSIRSLAPTPTPALVCEHLVRLAGLGGGPEGVPDWQDDRTVFAFRVTAPHGEVLAR